MSPDNRRIRVTNHCFPRVSGDEPLTRVWSIFRCMFSPRERG